MQNKIENQNQSEEDTSKISTLSEYFKEVVYGGIDGIVTTFVVVAGFSGAALSTDSTTQLTFAVVLLFGLANLFADATSMGLGNFLSVRSEKDLYRITRKKEEKKIKQNQQAGQGIKVTEASIQMMTSKGFSPEDAKTLISVYEKNPEYFLDFIMSHKLEMTNPAGINPIFTGSATFLSFLFFGTIPLLPFILMESEVVGTAFYLSVIGTFIALIILALLKWRVVGVSLYSALIEVLLVGGVAATIAYYVGTFFKI